VATLVKTVVGHKSVRKP